MKMITEIYELYLSTITTVKMETNNCLLLIHVCTGFEIKLTANWPRKNPFKVMRTEDFRSGTNKPKDCKIAQGKLHQTYEQFRST